MSVSSIEIPSSEYLRLLNETQTQIERLMLLQRISADLTASLDLERVLQTCLERVQFVLASEGASILMVDGSELVFRIAIGNKADKLKPFRVPLGEGLAGWVAQHQRGAYSNDVRRDPRFYAGVDKGSGFVTQALLAAPLIAHERVIGVLEVTNKPGGFDDADLNLLMTIAPIAAIAIENARLYQLAVERGRIERELQMAREVQTNLIPTHTPQIAGWEFAAYWQPAQEVSGDFYDFVPIRLARLAPAHHAHESELGMVIADVSGHGLPAALFMASTRSILRASVAQARSIAEGITQANRLICADATNGMFVTLCYAQLTPGSAQMAFINAGHNPPLWYHAADHTLSELSNHAIPLGIAETRVYEHHSLDLASGDFVVFYTDGVTEAVDLDADEFGVEQLRSLLLTHAKASPTQLITTIRRALREFVGDAEPYDDITLVIAKRL